MSMSEHEKLTSKWVRVPQHEKLTSKWVRVPQSLVFCVACCGSVCIFVICFLLSFDVRLLVTPFVLS